MKVFQTTASVTVPDLPKTSLSMVINVARDILITIK
jgi:hypothetical protein